MTTDERIREAAKRIADAAPPLTVEQRELLRALFRPVVRKEQAVAR